MATVITHALVAGTFATVLPKEVAQQISRTRLVLVLAVLAVVPDFDVIGFRFGIAYGDALGHRGFTHSLFFAAIVALLVPSLAFRAIPIRSRAWWTLVGFAFVATISHGILDAFTDAGLGIGFLIPFENSRYFAPWRPLATSPLSVSAFLNGPALRILANELAWVGLPLVAIFGSWHGMRWLVGRRQTDH